MPANEPALALNEAVAEPAGMDTLAGTVMVPVEVNAIEVAAATAVLIVTVHAATAEGPSDDGLQAIVLRVGTMIPEEMDPPVTTVGIGSPAAVEPSPPATPMAARLAPVARVTATLATVPSEIALPFIPLATQT